MLWNNLFGQFKGVSFIFSLIKILISNSLPGFEGQRGSWEEEVADAVRCKASNREMR